MRILLAAGVTLFLASSGSAMAAECTKGLLWPYVRNPGDCLTDEEVKSGRLGQYNGPATGTVMPPAQAAGTSPPTQAASTPASAAAAQSVAAQTANAPQAAITAAASATCEKGWLWPFVRESGDCPTAVERKAGAQAKPASGQGNLLSAILGSDNAAKPAAAQPAAAPAPVQVPAVQAIVQSATTPASCTKGVLWPFVRESGDCPTAAELKSGNARPPATPVKATQPAAAPAAAVAAVTPASSVAAAPAAAQAPVQATAVQAIVQSATTPASCTKGLLWPFVRNEGDCPTTAEVKSGSTRSAATPVKATQPAAAVPAVAPVSSVATVPAVAPAAPPAPSAANDTSSPNSESCHKGLFWPFVREPGDCPTDADKGVKRPGRT